MNKFFTSLLLLCILSFSVAGAAQAVIFTPTPQDVGDLDHSYYYAWEINWAIPSGYSIDTATLNINGINDWTAETNDALYIHLMDSILGGTKAAGSNVYRWYDNQGGGDNWAGTPLIATYSDNTNPAGATENLVYNFDSSLISYLTNFISNDNRIYIGFDPDCHYYNNKVTLEITTKSVPEPGTLVLFGSGLIGLGLFRRRRNS